MRTERRPGHRQETYACAECGLRYRDRETAARCQAWCGEHKSCNLEIIKFALPDEPGKD